MIDWIKIEYQGELATKSRDGKYIIYPTRDGRYNVDCKLESAYVWAGTVKSFKLAKAMCLLDQEHGLFSNSEHC